LLRPLGPEPGQLYPLILFLHGAGERGSDNSRQLAYLPAWLAEPAWREAFPCYVLAPQCRDDQKWADVDWSKIETTPLSATPTVDMLAVIAALEDTLKRESVDPTRIYLTGLSMGGYGSWDLAARTPERFAAILPICGGGDERVDATIATLPIWCFHGDADNVVHVTGTTAAIDALDAAGIETKVTIYPQVGHNSWDAAYREPELAKWLLSHSRPQG
jgi:predicted peptidase